MLITICNDCSEEATATCPRCGRSFCLQHTTLPQGVCMACEADYQHRRPGSLTRLIGVLAAIVLFAVAIVWIYNAARFHMLPWIVFAAATLIFAVPLAGARLYEKLRRCRFLAERLPHVGQDTSPQLEARGPFR
jgi:uncharacterized protein (DUF983 family)